MNQMESFAGNMIQLQGRDDKHYVIMSETAYNSLRDDQIDKIKSLTNIIIGKIPTIEKFGGGSVRCMIAENFLPPK